jgi:hypothetical protein
MSKQPNQFAVKKADATAITAEIGKAVAAILKRHGLDPIQTKTHYGDEYRYTVRAAAVECDANGVNRKSPEAILYERDGYIGQTAAGLLTLTAPLGTKFAYAKQEFYFAGVGTRGKRKIVGQNASGQKFDFGDSVIPIINGAAA